MSENNIGLQPKVIYVGPTLKKGLLSRYTVFRVPKIDSRAPRKKPRAAGPFCTRLDAGFGASTRGY